MNSLLEVVGEILLSGCGPKKDSPVLRLFVMFTMSLAGICFLAFAGLVIIHAPWRGVLLWLFLVGLAGVSFWLVARAKRS